MASFWLFCTLTANMLVYLFASDTCEKTINLCKLSLGGDSVFKLPQIGQKGDKGVKGEFGIKGERGYDGEPGPAGSKGAKGDPGEMGFRGPTGWKGKRGDAGSKGLKGMKGSPGLAGIEGQQGRPGLKGLSGTRGQQGNKGRAGHAGPPGPPGENGTCPCVFPEVTLTDDFGTFDNPANVLCKASATTPVKTGEYYVGPSSKPIKVQCINRGNLTTLTCIQPLEDVNRTTFYYDKNVWLSELGLSLTDIYGISRDQIAWLTSRSSSAYQTIRYHCLNSSPFPKTDENSYLLLLSWDDRVIGPMPTLSRTFFYSIPPETDGCNTEGVWKYTDIKLVSNTNRRLPVTDFFVRDIRPYQIIFGISQGIEIEHRSLCFD